MSTPAFDVCGPLPAGTVVLEASAGTGKTFTIAALAARYVAAGVPLDRILLVTFTRMATGELRERVRDRLVSVERGLAHVAAGGPPPADEVVALLARGSTSEVAERRRLLAAALSDFDAATIATTHGFCQHMLAGLGVAGDIEEGTTFVDDATDLVAEVVDDLYIRKFAAKAEAPPFSRDEARRIGLLAVGHPGAPIEPSDAPDGTDRALRASLAKVVRTEVEARKRRRGLVTYDDLLTRLAAALSDPVRGAAACARLRERYRVALVDEFQDTDPIQWDILRRAFAEGGDDGSTLVLIGDPKQAIYAFRGADVHAYLEAARHAREQATLGINWRSDQQLLDAYDALWRGTRLGHDDIRYRVVRAAPAHRDPGLIGGPDPAALRIRIARRDDGLPLTKGGYATRAPALAHVAADVAGDIAELLGGKTELIERNAEGDETGRRPLRPAHVAVLVRTNQQGVLVRDALATVGVPAVLNGAGSVFTTTVARDWLCLLEALERPSSPIRVHTAALSLFIGWDGERVATAADDEWEDVFARLHRWAGVLRRRGVAALVEATSATGDLTARLLSRPDGERVLTDLRHIGELLHGEAVASGLGVTALAGWLRRRIAEAAEDSSDEDRARRLESDAEAVQVLTIHRAKGLEFPVVHLPYLWDCGRIPDDASPVYHDPAHGDRLTIDVGRAGRDFTLHHEQFVAEQRGEDLRLAYVALARARHQAVVWWVSSWESRSSPLGRLVACRDEDGRVAADGSVVPSEDEVAAWFERLAADAALAPGTISVRTTATGGGRPWADTPRAGAALEANRFSRLLDGDWRRTSYSALTATVHNGVVAEGEPHDPEPGDGTVTDEAMAEGDGTTDPPPPADAGPDAAALAEPVPLADMPGGAAVGSLLHAVLEDADFTAPDLDAELARHLATAQARGRVEIGDPVRALAGIRSAIETPLGPLAGGLALRDIGRADRLDELAFELPLGGGDVAAAPAAQGPAPTVAAVAELLRARVPAGDPLVGYADRLAVPELQHDLRGFLTGAIDVVLRVRDPGGDTRYVVVDHKTNWLGEPGEPLTVGHYRPAALATAMQRAHYPLQALLYSVALHRYLRWRLPAYDPDRHLGGVLYLFLRGMTGRSVPHVDGQPCGVFAWRAPVGLVPALSDLLDEGPS